VSFLGSEVMASGFRKGLVLRLLLTELMVELEERGLRREGMMRTMAANGGVYPWAEEGITGQW
jgi:hypothetical protein